MATPADNLHRLYDIALNSGSDSEFYQNVYQYCDLVFTNPILAEILGKAGIEYGRKSGDIWDDKSKSSKTKEEEMYRMERFSMAANFASLEMRIYYPIKDYKSSRGPEGEQDPLALLMVKGIKNIKNSKYDKKTLQMYNRWFEGDRGMYERDLRLFHADMLSQLEKHASEPQEHSIPPDVSFTLETGDFRIRKMNGSLNPSGQEYAIFKLLYEAQGNIVPYLKLIHTFRPEAENATKGYKFDLSKLINALKVKLGEERNCIVNKRLLGYRLVFTDG
jgi:hypothetical protein